MEMKIRLINIMVLLMLKSKLLNRLDITLSFWLHTWHLLDHLLSNLAILVYTFFRQESLYISAPKLIGLFDGGLIIPYFGNVFWGDFFFIQSDSLSSIINIEEFGISINPNNTQ